MLIKLLRREIDTLDTIECEALDLLNGLAARMGESDPPELTTSLGELYALLCQMIIKTNDVLDIASTLERMPAPRMEVAR